MTQQQNDNIKLIIASLNKYGITNQNLQAGILATVSKESNFIPQNENLNYSFENIKRVWVKTPDDVATAMAHNPEKFGNWRYSTNFFPNGGNGLTDGYKYRGRGFNQITFKNTYKAIGDKIGVDLVSNPDLLNDPKVASDALAVFYRDELKAGDKAGSFKKFGVDDSTMVSDTTTATKIAVQINAGRGTNFDNSVVKEGYNKALAQVDSLLQTVKDYTGSAIETVKKKPLMTAIAVGAIAITLFVTYKLIKKNK